MIVSNSKSILFSEQYYFPEGWSGADIPRDITRCIVDDFCRLSVFCGNKQYCNTVEISAEDDPRKYGIRIIHLYTLGLGSSFFLRALDGFLFSSQVFIQILFYKSFDLVVVQTNPPVALLFVALACFLRRKPYLIISMDVYPDAFFADQEHAPLLLLKPVLDSLFNLAYRKARYVVSLGATMSKRLGLKGVSMEKLVYIPNWATGDTGVVRGAANYLAKEWQVLSSFNIVYSGNLGKPHELETVIRAVALLDVQKVAVRLVCIVSGSRVESCKRFSDELGVSDRILFKDLVPKSMLPFTMGLASLAVVSVLPGFEGVVVPSKFSGYLARGIPVLYVGPKSEISEILDDSGAGASFMNGDIVGVRYFIESLVANPAMHQSMSQSARNYYTQFFDSSIGLKRYKDLVVDSLRVRKTSP